MLPENCKGFAWTSTPGHGIRPMTINRAVTTLLVFHLVTTVAIGLYGDERANVVGEPELNGNTANAPHADSPVESTETGDPTKGSWALT